MAAASPPEDGAAAAARAAEAVGGGSAPSGGSALRVVRTHFSSSAKMLSGDVGARLLQTVRVNQMTLCLLQRGAEEEKAGAASSAQLLLAVEVEGGAAPLLVTAVFFRVLVLSSPPQPPTDARLLGLALDAIVDAVAPVVAQMSEFAVQADAEVAEGFAAAFLRRAGSKWARGSVMREWQYACTPETLRPPPRAVEGRMIAGELGKADHVEALTALLGEFQRAVSIPASRPKSQPELVAWARELLAERGVLFWETADGALVAALHLSPGPLVERVGIVVTRDSCRRRGYGGALVYAATRRVFEELKKPLAALFADAENPDSNSLYSKLGYVVVNECRLIELRRADGGEPRSKEV